VRRDLGGAVRFLLGAELRGTGPGRAA
jgi:hypothetical protein